MGKKKKSRIRINNLTKDLIQIFLISFLLLPFEFFLYKIFSQRALAFGCFDDCSNYIAGYFMLNGKVLYSQVFFNHIMGMAYFSYVVQFLHNSINIYDLVLSHRQAIMMVGFIFHVLIIKRFKWTGALFVVLYELSKFYLFGDRFLGESIAVYGAVFLMGLVWEKLQEKKLSFFDYAISGIFTWFIIFTREPYIPLALVLYGIILWRSVIKAKIFSASIFLALTGFVLVNTRLSDFYFNDFTVNFLTAIPGEANSNKLFGEGLVKIFLYPLYLFVGGKWNVFRIFEICLSLSFLTSLGILLKNKKWKQVLLIIIILGAANMRYVTPGQIFYEAYYQMVWFGLFLAITLLLVSYILKRYKKIGAVLLGVIVVGWCIAVFSPSSYLFDRVNLQEQLLTNFGTEMNVGNVVKNISKPEDTLFLDGADDMIYWVSGLSSSYRYSWYTGLMPLFTLYTEERIRMFKNNPPDFYYDFCSSEAPHNTRLPGFVRPAYQQLYSNGKQSCLYVLKSKLDSISDVQWEKAKEGFYSLKK